MASATAERAVRDYLVALKDPASLRDDEKIAKLQRELAEATDEIARLRLRQQILEAQNPPIERYEEAFVTHAKAWAQESGITEKAFLDEGVPPEVLRRAGFRVPTGRRGRPRKTGAGRRQRTRVSAEDVRAAIPKGRFTIKDLQDRTGASAGVVRRIVREEEQAGRVKQDGTDTSHKGPGRSPVVYTRTK